jgi:GNAT superfamily N-acetyltransferase
VVDPVRILVAETAAMAAPPERLTAFVVDWPPLEVLREIWAEGGIGPGRVAVMDRVQGPKCALMGRAEDRPAAAAFVACDGPVAMLHALEVRPPLRRQGTARHLMRAAALWARGAGATWLALLVTEANRPAGALYASLGMQAVGSYHYRAGPEEPRAGGGQP